MIDTTTSTGFLDDGRLIARVLEHLDQGTTDLADSSWREPVEHYRSPERFATELELLRTWPSAFCASAAVGEPGAYVARDRLGVPVVVVRGRDGVARAFRNSCRHRGTVLVDGDGCASSLTCPYHGWIYGLDGALRRVPDEHGFPGLDRDQRGLVPLVTDERDGLVFVAEAADDAGRPPAELGAVPSRLDGSERVVSTATFEIEANWKIFLEGFLEGYHLRATHPTSFLPFGYDNVNVVETVGRNSRVTFPFRRVEVLRDAPEATWSADHVVTTVSLVFPNTIVANLSRHTTVVVLEPFAVDRTRLHTTQLSSATTGRAGPRDESAAARDASFVALGAIEDRDMALRVQRGLGAGANDVLEFGRFEGAISAFHRDLTDLLEA